MSARQLKSRLLKSARNGIRAIKFVQDQADLRAAEIAAIELLYLRLFHFEENRKPRSLFSQIASDPSFFVEMVEWYSDRAKAGDADKNISLVKRETAWELLEMASVLPGSNGSEIDADKLLDWVDEARTKLAEAGCGPWEDCNGCTID